MGSITDKLNDMEKAPANLVDGCSRTPADEVFWEKCFLAAIQGGVTSVEYADNIANKALKLKKEKFKC